MQHVYLHQVRTSKASAQSSFTFLRISPLNTNNCAADGLLVATHSLSERLSLYKVQIMWNPPQWDPALQRQASGILPFPVPSIHISHCKTEIPERVFEFNKDQADDLQNGSSNQSLQKMNTNRAKNHLHASQSSVQV